MNDSLYLKKVKCPICGMDFEAVKVKTKACIVDKKDEDFCVHYKGINPMFYEIFVCPQCGYSASETSFDDISNAERLLLQEAFSGRKIGRNFCSERTLNDAIDSYKLALYTATKRNSKNSTIAGLSLKIAWMYRVAGDNEKEINFINYALENYYEAYSREKPPFGALSELTMQYLLGELYRRVGKYEDAITWFGRVISNPERKTNPRIENLARDQWALAKEQFGAVKKEA